MPTMRTSKWAAVSTPRTRGQEIEDYKANTKEKEVTKWKEERREIELPSLQVADTGSWKKDSACLESDLDFIPKTMSPSNADALREVCNRCLERQECGDFAITNNIEWGMYGGMTPKERKGA